jgi:hypothetical protein
MASHRVSLFSSIGVDDCEDSSKPKAVFCKKSGVLIIYRTDEQPPQSPNPIGLCGK